MSFSLNYVLISIMVYTNIKAAFKAVLDKEKQGLLKSDLFRTPLTCYEQGPLGIPIRIPMDHEDYSYSAFYNEADSDQYVLSRLQSQRFSLKPNLKGRKYLFRGQSQYIFKCK